MLAGLKKSPRLHPAHSGQAKENNNQRAENTARTVLFLAAAEYLEMKVTAPSRRKGREVGGEDMDGRETGQQAMLRT